MFPCGHFRGGIRGTHGTGAGDACCSRRSVGIDISQGPAVLGQPAGRGWRPMRHQRGGMCATVGLVIAVGGCDRESLEVGDQPSPPVEFVVDTVAVVHSDLLFRVRGIRRTPDGGLAVLNQGSVNIVLLDSLGHSMGTIGRLGEGPGEFFATTDFDVKRDSILVLDALARRVHLFHRASPENMWSLHQITGTLQQVAFARDGTPVVSVARDPYLDPADAAQVLRRTVEFHRVDEPGSVLRTPIEVRGGEFFVVWHANGAMRTTIPAFAARATYDLTWTGVVVADAREGRVISFSWDGEPARTLRSASPPVPVSEAELERFWEQVRAVAGDSPDRSYMTYMREAVEVWGKSVPRPFYTKVVSDGFESLIRHYASGTSGAATWSLLAADGEPLGTFNLDRNIQLFSLQDREAIGVGRDALGVEHVIVLRIRDPS